MDPTLISFAIRGIFRLGNAGKLAFEQHARNKAVLLPDTFVNELSEDTQLNLLVTRHLNALVGRGAPCEAYWENGAPRVINGSDNESKAHLRAALIRLQVIQKAQDNHRSVAEAEAVGGVMLVEQWRRGDGPPHPWVQIAVTIADLALEFVSAKPELIGVGGNGAKIVGSIADNIAQLIPPNVSEFDPKAVLGERLIASFLKGALQGMSQNAEGMFREEHLRELVTKSLAPVIAKIDQVEADDTIDTEEWLSVVETLTGPAAQAAIGVLAAHAPTFLGSRFEPGKAIGSLTKAMLLEAAKKDVRESFSESGMLALFKAAAGVAAARPELFIGKPDDEIERLAGELFTRTMMIFRKADAPFSGDVVLEIAAAALDTFSENAATLFGAHDDWDEVVTAAVQMVTDGFKDGFRRADDRTLEQIFTREKLVALGRVLLTQVAANPKMIVGEIDGPGGAARTQEVRRITTAVASAMAADEKMLLDGDDWLLIVEVAIREAAANPGPLFGLDDTEPKEAVGHAVIVTLLTVAHKGIDQTKRQQGEILFGVTLRDAIAETLQRAPRNLALLKTESGRKMLADLIEKTRDYVKDNKDRLGSRQWLKLYLYLLDTLLAAGRFEMPDDAKVKKILDED